MVGMGFLACAMERRRFVERAAARLIALHGHDAGLVASHLATHPELNADVRQRWSGLARVIERRFGRGGRFHEHARAREAAARIGAP
jgi:hypothetical protein